MISFKQLNYALAVEKTLHFKKASELCHVSQSALSTALAELESQLDLKIFERDNKKVLVTPIGKEVLERARRIILDVESLHHLADSQKAPLSFPISIGVIPTIAPFLLPKLFPILNQSKPDAQVNLIEDESKTLVDMVRTGQIDAAIIALPFECDGLLTLEFWQEDFYWVGLKDKHNAQIKEISSDEISNDKLMLLNEGHCLKEHILDACKFSQHASQFGLRATSLSTLIQMVQGNLGTTLIPAMAKNQLIEDNEKLTAIHLNEPSPHRRIAFILRPNYTRYTSVESLVELCQLALSESYTK